jgi:hypothetical protein
LLQLSFTLTVSVIVVECDSVPLVPVTVMTKVPVAAEPDAVKVMVECPVPPETTVTLTGLNDAVVPLPVPVAVSVIVPLNPFNDVNVIVEVPLLP